MGFDMLLGNDRLKQNLINSLSKGRISHFYLISGPSGSGKHTLARLLAAAILCKNTDAPCMSCPACRKAMENNHPDLITVDDPEHKTVSVKLVRQAREDMYILPNESDHKIYLFPQDLGIEGQNALLKILEEPPSYGVFLLLTNNPEQLLPTVRSRCTELALTALPESVLIPELGKAFPQCTPDALAAAAARSGGYLGQARVLLEQGTAFSPQTEQFLSAYAEKNTLALAHLLASMEKWKRDQLIPVLESWASLLEEALACRSGRPSFHSAISGIAGKRTSQELSQAIFHLQKAISYGQSNVSPAALCGYLIWQLK